jgi:acetyl esterase/lipase
VHGGAWQSGTKENPPLYMLGYGYAIASIGFRNSGDAKFPGPVHDIKAAIRYLRANAGKYGYDSEKIIIMGSSSGGHLAALVATTNGNLSLEGSLGNYTKTYRPVLIFMAQLICLQYCTKVHLMV